VDVSVIVPSHGAARTLPATLEALERQTLARERYEVIVVDTRADGTQRALDGAWVVSAPLRDGPAAKRNAGARAARGRVLAFTDADCLPEPGWLEAGLAAGAQVVQGRTLPPDGQAPELLSHRVVVRAESSLFETSNVFYERDLFESLGGFSTRYYRRFGVPFGEDAEFGWRARRIGASFAFEPDAVVRHPVGRPSLAAHLREQWLARGFPELIKAAPELRRQRLYRGLFLSRRSAVFALAATGAALAPRLPAAGLLAIPYARELAKELPPRSAGAAQRARSAGAQLLSDAALEAALVAGSVRARSPVL
jgi:glycosyltransferase involved in cell wall biosynthesis